MGQNKSVDFATGLFIFLGLAAMFFLLTQTTNIEAYGDEGYTVTARFSNIGNLKERAPVSLSGVTIGRVKKIEVDPERLDAVVTFTIDSRYSAIPADSSVSILTAGLLGEKYLGIEPGGDIENLKDGDEVLFTQSAVVLENLISKYLFDTASGGEE
ncbi:MAG TPA: outer membrane lipid asymmetry maintenance protein MlaD [Gammaproteobacteria bacterium]|nr:outer membrane lipid asymmetry maintenance protein MlaD [Gammaproteobacteria bacterium]